MTYVNEIEKENFVLLYPNPFSSKVILQMNNFLYNATLIVDNYFGQTVKKVKKISGSTIIFQRDDLPSG